MDPSARRRSPTRSTTAPRRCSSARSTATGATLGEDARPLPAADRAARRRRGRPPRRPARAAAPAAPSAGARALRRARRAAGGGARATRVPRRAGARALRRPRGALDAAAAAAADRRLRAHAGAARRTRSAGRSRAAARRRSPTRSPRTCARSAARSRPVERCDRWTSSHGARAVLLDVTPAAARSRSPATGCPAATGAALAALPLRAGRVQARLGARRRRSPGARRGVRGARRPCTSAATLDEIAASERAPWRGASPQRPFVLARAAEPVRPDARARGQAHGLGVLPRPERLARRHDRADRGAGRALRTRLPRPHPRPRRRSGPREIERYNANYVGGDINGGAADLRQLFTRPVARARPYTTPLAGVYLCSSSTPPGGGVHGMCGWHAAQAALRRLDAVTVPERARV